MAFGHGHRSGRCQFLTFYRDGLKFLLSNPFLLRLKSIMHSAPSGLKIAYFQKLMIRSIIHTITFNRYLTFEATISKAYTSRKTWSLIFSLTPRLSAGTQESHLVWLIFWKTFYIQQVSICHQRENQLLKYTFWFLVINMDYPFK